MPDEEQRRKQVISEAKTDFARWGSLESLEAQWEARAARAADRIPCGASVLDMGCGAMTLEKYLPAACRYFPCDVVKRDARTIVCDFNKGEIPDAIRDVDRVVLLGVLEYIYDLPKFLAALAAAGKPVVASYCPTDFAEAADRGALGWVNHYSTAELQALFSAAGLGVRSLERIDPLQALFVLDHIPVAKPPKNVVVLSCGNCGNFGDRLGYHLLTSALPSHARVWHAYFTPWPNIAGDIDLLVVGTGNSLYAPLLTDELIALIRRSRKSIGIFGTQYRSQFEANRLRQVIGELDGWFARYEEDLLLYGSANPRAVHLGDWLVDAFPMACATDDRVLNIGQEIWNDLPLDRVIQRIQSHKAVNSTRMHPLLCALTSAQRVAYSEQREMGDGSVSGKFRSMLLDVFGRTYPEHQFWEVDADAVRAYKAKVRRGLEGLRSRIAELIG